MNQHTNPKSLTAAGPALASLRKAVHAAVDAVPPNWPLDSAVAVNPFLGQAHLGLAEAASLIARATGTTPLPPRTHFAAAIADGRITEDDLAEALARTGETALTAQDLIQAAGTARADAAPLPTLVDLAAKETGLDIPALMTERLGALAAQHYDAGAALWPLGADTLYAAWTDTAPHDRTLDIAGLADLRAAFAAAPTTAEAALHDAAAALGLPDAALPLYFHRLLMTLPGWAQYARGLHWRADLNGTTDAAPIDLLAVRVTWESALLETIPLSTAWAEAQSAYTAPPEAARIDALLQDAADIGAQRRLAATLAKPQAKGAVQRPALQAAFCIDVRSEVFRRALEAQDVGIETIGFAGFFGLAVSHVPFGAERAEARCPVLLTPGVTAHATGSETDLQAKRLDHRANTAWQRFRTAAVSCFGFVETLGPAYLPKLVRDAMGHGAAEGCGHDHSHPPAFAPALDLPARIDTAEAVLRAMSLTENFAPVVILAGHGGNTVNNAHAAALDCGACGGHSGEANARLLAGLLNDPQVRTALVERGIDLPNDSAFVAALHDTTTDAMTLFDAPKSDAIAQARGWLKAAGKATRAERAPRLPGAAPRALPDRAGDWAQIRPEWALAGCAAFIAAPRGMTAGRDLQGRAFLHSYDWQADKAQGYSTLELILTAPVVVASWISLAYYGATTAPEVFGGGNKLLHNVTGGIGVLEGNGGDLRAGLPLQSVHDGTGFVHEPLRLAVCVAAPAEAITDILARHDGVRALFDNGWLSLHTMNGAGQLDQRYAGDLAWADQAPAESAAA